IQADGRILIGGNFTNYNGTTRIRIARLETNGSLDAVFDPGRGADNVVYSMALEPDGKVVIGGAFTVVNGFVRPGVARPKGGDPVYRLASTSAPGWTRGSPSCWMQLVLQPSALRCGSGGLRRSAGPWCLIHLDHPGWTRSWVDMRGPTWLLSCSWIPTMTRSR